MCGRRGATEERPQVAGLPGVTAIGFREPLLARPQRRRQRLELRGEVLAPKGLGSLRRAHVASQPGGVARDTAPGILERLLEELQGGLGVAAVLAAELPVAVGAAALKPVRKKAWKMKKLRDKLTSL